jgi:hypothetical protein
MSAFEDFVQLELPKRPYLETDVSTETVIVRRGLGPRQLSSVSMTDGQVLGKVGGVLTGVSIGAGATFKKYSETIAVASSTWTITHGQASSVFIAQAFDAAGNVIIPDEIQTTSSSVVTVLFNTAQTGSIKLIFLE